LGPGTAECVTGKTAPRPPARNEARGNGPRTLSSAPRGHGPAYARPNPSASSPYPSPQYPAAAA
jgi:hypothetical protein